MLGTEGITLYQYNKSTDSYTISIEIKSREYKEQIKEFKIIKKSITSQIKDSVTVAIDLASHKVALGKLDEPIVHLQSTIGSTIHTPEQFIRANQEIYAVINELQQRVTVSLPLCGYERFLCSPCVCKGWITEHRVATLAIAARPDGVVLTCVGK